MTDRIEKIRKHIDRIDTMIITALAERMSLMPEMALYKKENNIPIFDEAREKEIINRLKEIAKEDNLDGKFVEAVFSSIFNEAKRIQNKVISKISSKPS